MKPGVLKNLVNFFHFFKILLIFNKLCDILCSTSNITKMATIIAFFHPKLAKKLLKWTLNSPKNRLTNRQYEIIFNKVISQLNFLFFGILHIGIVKWKYYPADFDEIILEQIQSHLATNTFMIHTNQDCSRDCFYSRDIQNYIINSSTTILRVTMSNSQIASLSALKNNAKTAQRQSTIESTIGVLTRSESF
eukprot:NODE_236_length_11993_cov_1.471078.p6 type:complete len:192 gc:universal NODE_236_length_11993_cov_1.471078:4671-5246(+)